MIDVEKPVQMAKVYKEQDRVALASILVANGYKVWFGKVKKSADKRSTDYVVCYQEICPGDAGAPE